MEEKNKKQNLYLPTVFMRVKVLEAMWDPLMP